MNYWIFIVTQHKLDGETLAADEIFNTRMGDRFWGLGEKTPNRRSLQKGDRVVFYLGLPHKTFAATAELSTASFQPTEQEQEILSHGKAFYKAEYGVRLDRIDSWTNPRSVEELIPHLKFIENKKSWFTYFQGGVRQTSEEDFHTIAQSREHSFVEKVARAEDIESESQFALESHLEEFMAENWEKIDFDQELVRYKTEDQDGRQFPAGAWSIDFLCVDKKSGDFVVVELKRGKTSDATVGQLLRYMGWVKENLCSENQSARGIIVAKEVDDALRYAVRDLSAVGVLTYKLHFQLNPFKQ